MRSMSQSTLKAIYLFQGILPSALYAIIILGSSPNLDALNDIHIRAARYIMKIKKSVPKDQVLHTCNWNSMEHYYKKSIACKTYKISNNLTSPLLGNLIKKSQSRSTRNHFKPDLPRLKYAKFKKSLMYRSCLEQLAQLLTLEKFFCKCF